MADPAPDPEIVDISATGTDLYTLSWVSVVGATYQIETSPDLAAGSWTTLPGDYVATKETTSAEVANNPGETRRFWRVRRLPRLHAKDENDVGGLLRVFGRCPDRQFGGHLLPFNACLRAKQTKLRRADTLYPTTLKNMRLPAWNICVPFGRTISRLMSVAFSPSTLMPPCCTRRRIAPLLSKSSEAPIISTKVAASPPGTRSAQPKLGISSGNLLPEKTCWNCCSSWRAASMEWNCPTSEEARCFLASIGWSAMSFSIFSSSSSSRSL